MVTHVPDRQGRSEAAAARVARGRGRCGLRTKRESARHNLTRKGAEQSAVQDADGWLLACPGVCGASVCPACAAAGPPGLCTAWPAPTASSTASRAVVAREKMDAMGPRSARELPSSGGGSARVKRWPAGPYATIAGLV